MPHVLPVGEAHHLLNQCLSAVVGGVRLAGHDQLDRPLLVEQQLLQPLLVAQHQRQPLVRRHPPREPDGQHVRIECRSDPTQLGIGGTAFQPRAAYPDPDVVDEQLRATVSESTTCARGRPDATAPTCRAVLDPRSCCRSVRGQARAIPAPPRSDACTPLVIDPIGTSLGSNPGHSSLNISLLTLPCSSDTPFARCASRRPMCAMLNFDGSSSSPKAMIRSSGTPGSNRESAPAGLPGRPPK